MIDLASENGIVEKSGAWYGFNGERIGQGRENAKEYLKEHPEVLRAIEAKVLEKFGIGTASLVQAVPDVKEEDEAEEKRPRVKAVKA